VELAIEGDPAFTVVIAHRDPDVRSQLIESLDREDEFEVIADTDSGGDALDTILEQLPDLVLVGDDLSDRASREVVRRVHNELPICTVVAVLDDTENAYDLLTAGAMSCLLVDQVDEPVEVVRGAARAESLITAAWAKRMIDDIAGFRRSTDGSPEGPELSDTEQEVLERLANGETPDVIAAQYEVSDRLVNLHTGYAVSKLHWAFDEQTQIEALQEVVG
jgi:DNA-binding NarL/FixJ family response regulator